MYNKCFAHSIYFAWAVICCSTGYVTVKNFIGGAKGFSLYRGDTPIGHSDPSFDTSPDWRLIGSTDDQCQEPDENSGENKCYYIALWNYVTNHYKIDFEAKSGTMIH